ncbi:HAD hydrolase-like protein [Streptomyces sp. NPDC048424]|uniref:HAD family hydrolase n=1 Tax=Streptomyces sp. NPDC048424 TaxID=3155265 RepID=UPI00343732F7
MPTQADVLGDVLSVSQAILFDFDGPICDVFRGLPALGIAEELADLLSTLAPALADAARSTDDPMVVHRISQQGGSTVLAAVEAALTSAEMRAVHVAGPPTEGAVQALHAARAAGRLVAVVSNNSAECVREYLTLHGLTRSIDAVIGRPLLRPDLMKPSPHLLLTAASTFAVAPYLTVLIGDSVTDIEAAHAAGAKSVGYANKPGKVTTLARSDANVVVLSMQAVAAALRTVA